MPSLCSFSFLHCHHNQHLSAWQCTCTYGLRLRDASTSPFHLSSPTHNLIFALFAFLYRRTPWPLAGCHCFTENLWKASLLKHKNEGVLFGKWCSQIWEEGLVRPTAALGQAWTGLSSRRQLWSAGPSRILECRVVEAMGPLLCDAGVPPLGVKLRCSSRQLKLKAPGLYFSPSTAAAAEKYSCAGCYLTFLYS